MVGFADREFGTRRYLLLQRSRSVSAEERERGEDDVHFELNGQEHSDYGVVEHLELKRSVAEVRLAKDKAALLEIAPEVRVSFSVDGDQYAALVAMMRQLWSHRPTVLVVEEG